MKKPNFGKVYAIGSKAEWDSKRERGDGHGRPLGMTERKLPKQGLFDLKRQFAGLRRHFLFPPFSVLRAMDGDWQKRKRQWLSLGIKSEVGRGTTEDQCSIKNQRKLTEFQKTRTESKMALHNDPMQRKRKYDGQGKRRLTKEEESRGPNGGHAGVLHKSSTGKDWKEEYQGGDVWSGAGTSIFDPVLCELAYRWWCPLNGQIIDPFAGGSVRGIVAHILGHRYWGSELRPEQVEANRQQANDLIPDDPPEWVCADARDALPQAPPADLIFTCPPYGNLEVYSTLPGDVSNMEYGEFRKAYLRIIGLAVERLRENRFAVIVVGNFRDKQGFYHDFVGDTVRCFAKAGMGFYNEAILVTAIGSLPVRVTRQFQSGRKLGKTHQNVLVFFKGDPSRIGEEFGHIQR